MAESNKSGLQRKLQEINRAAEERDAERRAKKLGIPYVDLRKTPASIKAVEVIPEEAAKKAGLVAIQISDRSIAIAAVDPSTPEAREVIQLLERERYIPKLFVASRLAIEQVWHLYGFVAHETKKITGEVEIGQKRLEELRQKLTSIGAVQQELESLGIEKASVTILAEAFLAGALANRASDIHFEAEKKGARLRYRVDGVLHDVVKEIPKKSYASIIARIKLLSGLKMNVYEEPQDGRFTIHVGEKGIEMRVSLIPSEYGETIVMRILDPDAINVSLAELGIRLDDLAIVEKELAKPNGLILNTGPTGSGKTTTLYAFLKNLSSPEMKIITVEDPIEYHLEGVEQTQVDAEAGYTFAGGLRAIVRQDPDIILVGEIRDLETADIALQASLTGHMVFSTLHTNDAVGTVPRLVDLGAKPQSIGPALSLAIAQRLVRVLCKVCKKKKDVPQDTEQKIHSFLERLPARVDRAPYQTITLFEPVGCKECNDFGYKGRKGIFEFFRGGADLEELILKDASYVALRKYARAQGMVTMQEDGILEAIRGVTSFKEVEDVTGPIVWE